MGQGPHMGPGTGAGEVSGQRGRGTDRDYKHLVNPVMDVYHLDHTDNRVYDMYVFV